LSLARVRIVARARRSDRKGLNTGGGGSALSPRARPHCRSRARRSDRKGLGGTKVANSKYGHLRRAVAIFEKLVATFGKRPHPAVPESGLLDPDSEILTSPA
jgi:hypothetical protein